MEQPGAGFGRTLAKGIVAGVVATAALVATREALWRMESEALRAHEMSLREGVEATGFQKPVHAVADKYGILLDKEEEQRVAQALAWGAGVAAVTAYAFARDRWPATRAGHGLAFGLAAWAIEDETLMPLAGMARPPQDYPWQAHARGLGAHAAYGVAAETTLKAMDSRAAAANDAPNGDAALAA